MYCGEIAGTNMVADQSGKIELTLTNFHMAKAFDFDSEAFLALAEAETSDSPVLKGYQTTDLTVADTYAIRLVSVINRIDCKSLGYLVTVSYVDGNGIHHTGNQTIECQYVYTSITENYGKDHISAEELNGNYIFALHIEGIPADYAVTYTVKPYVDFGNQTILYGAETSFTVSR